MKSKKGNRRTIEVSNVTTIGVCRWIQKSSIPFRSHSTRRRTVGYKELLKNSTHRKRPIYFDFQEPSRLPAVRVRTNLGDSLCWRECRLGPPAMELGADDDWRPPSEEPAGATRLNPATTRRRRANDLWSSELRLRPRDFVINRNKCKCPFFLKTKLITTTVASRAEATGLSDRCVSIMRGGHFPVRFGVEVEVMTAFGGEMRASQTFDWTRLRKFIIMFEMRVRMIIFRPCWWIFGHKPVNSFRLSLPVRASVWKGTHCTIRVLKFWDQLLGTCWKKNFV